ncbi:MAG: hypothetical protein CVU79_05010 [Elusimicrobia bacterium HGW-Elusimicrobia-3]|jgi:hypothetical protein|nr:MAG: hypothetical protein CVU79_05010 [Elusimicrobia bacterium HGW-Elusimicrobia-3]
MKKLIPLLFLFVCAAACLPPAKPQPVRKEAAVRLSPEQAKKVEQLYYKAVGAYSRNDMAAADALIKEILAINPSHKPSQELRKKVRLAVKAN